ncbi:HesA/MoeB/ThiF family protein [Tropicimonas sp. IMCC34011]|uniref:HesA/MoeB/ThiF family protein n=1 Tax=Tropicimonas sp. IMCC34011 TaxID=2248759 RepID=UPI000E27C754|nr:HesA/MoeB/ThiF family protein [Tropicimonas sp. IMCC34011]
MLVVFALAAAIWVIGGRAGLPKGTRWLLLALLYGAVLVAQVALPDGNPLRAATGGEPAFWLFLGGVGLAVWGYTRLLAALKRCVAPRTDEAPAASGPFSQAELSRYARHITLREIGGPGQRALKDAKVLVIGAGGLGSPALLYLAGAGIGTIGVIDGDAVEGTNLQRQVIHRDADIGRSKAHSARDAMLALNPFIEVRAYHRRFEESIAGELVAEYDIVLDGTDNFETRYLANSAAVAARRPLISGALSQWEGQVSIFDPAGGGPCYRCVFPEAPAPGLAPSCAEAGVAGPLPGVVGSMMAVEAVKLIAKIGAPLRGEMLIYDALWGETRKIGLKRRADCPTCGSGAVAS